MQGDCLEQMDILIKENITVDLILTDLPYSTTKCSWDKLIPFEPMWDRLKKLIKPNGAIVLFGVEPFSSLLRTSNLEMYKYDWYWDKKHGSNFAQANRRPLKNIETISVFCKKQSVYYPIKVPNPKGEEKRSKYKPSKQKEVFEGQVATTKEYSTPSSGYESDKLLPKCLIQFSRESKPVHPTQKPIALLEYLIKTYTLEKETVLDFTMGSGSCGVAARNLNRNFIGIELDERYYQIANNRIIENFGLLNLF